MKFTDAIKLSRKSVRCGHSLLRARRQALAEKNTAVAVELWGLILFMRDSAIASLAAARKEVRT